MGKERNTLLWGGRKSIVLLKGSQASRAHPSDKSRLKVKMLEWLEALLGTGPKEF
jgi:hypothetical protein